MATAAQPPKRTLPRDTLQGILGAHDDWLSSGGDRGDRADLSNTDLADADLSGLNLTAAILSGADLSGADLSHTLLDKVDATRADFSGAELNQASLVGANLTWADLSRADLSGAVLTDAALSDAELIGAKLVQTDFTGAELDGADLTDANLDGAVMVGTDMSGARFSGSNDNLDGHLDAAFEADQVYEEPADEPISELPDADDPDLRSADPGGAASPSGVTSGHAGPGNHIGVTPNLRSADLRSADPGGAASPSGATSGHAGPGNHVKTTPEKTATSDHATPETTTSPPNAPDAALAPEGDDITAPPTPGGPAHRRSQVAARLAAHGAWLASDGREGRRADLSDLGPIPLESLAGADLYQATLPTDHGLPGEGVQEACSRLGRRAAQVGRGLAALLLACGYGILALNAALMMPGAPVRLPLFGSAAHPLTVAIGIPLVLLFGYLWLHGAIQHLSRQSRMLPKRLPDGSRPLEIAGALVATPAGPPLWRLAGWITRLMAWGAVPGILAFYWGAFLPIASQSGAAVLGLFIAIAAGIGMTSLLRNTRAR